MRYSWWSKQGELYLFITVLLYNLGPSIIIILPLNILHPHAPPFPLRILIFCVPSQFCHKLVAWFESHLELVTDGFEMVPLVFSVPHAFVWVGMMGLLALELLAMGASVLCLRFITVLLLFLL
jgi:hypothetical protein